MHQLIELSEFPPESCDSLLDWINEIALVYWQDYSDLAWLHQGLNAQQPKLPELTEPGWHALTDWYWKPIGLNDLPLALTLDVEAHKGDDGAYRPKMAVGFGLSIFGQGGQWYAWKSSAEQELLIPFPRGRLVVGHNVAAHDSRYLSSEYCDPDPNPYESGLKLAGTTYLDTMAMATLTRGLSSKTMEALYQKCKAAISSGQQAPPWYEHAWQVSLKELAKRLLGLDLGKSVRAKWDADYLEAEHDTLVGSDLLNYCALDVWVTHQLFQKLFPIVDKQFFASPVTWAGLAEMGKCRLYLKDWSGFLTSCEAEYAAAKKELSAFVEELATEAAPEQFPDWDWKLLARGPYKGYPKWRQSLEKAGYSLGTRMAVELLQLSWDGEPIAWHQETSRFGLWVTATSRQPLPHPRGNERLDSPLCSDYRGFAASSRLTSAVLEQDGLLDLFDALASVAQWQNFRGRYQALHRPYQDGGLDVIKPEINPCGTLTRRATSPIWVVAPREVEGRIGSQIHQHIVAPPGYSLVYADFDSQESWLMTLLTDAQAGEIASNDWCKAVLFGDKTQGTDIHSLVAEKMAVSRPDAKKLNFAAGYGAGVIRLTNLLWVAVNCPREQAELKAAEFHDYLKGDDGIAKSTFATLKALARTAHLRTSILGAKVPDSLNAAWLDSEFMTTRQNWVVQSAGVDCLHALIVLCKAFFEECDVEAYLALHRHDAVYWYVRQGQEQTANDCLQTAHFWVKRLAYEQAAKQAHQQKAKAGYAGELQPLRPPENVLWFSSVDVGGHAGEF